MKKISILVTSLLLSCGSLAAQTVSVIETVKLTDAAENGQFYFPRMSPDGNKVFLTRENYQGLWYYDMNSHKIVAVTEDAGAGYKFAFSKDGSTVFFRSNVMGEFGIRTSQKIVEKNIAANTETVLAEGDNLSTPLQVNTASLAYAREDELAVRNLTDAPAQKAVLSRPAVKIVEGGMLLYVNGEKRKLAPFGEGHYVWPSVSPDGKKILFTLAGKGAFICDLSGKILSELGKANAPVWSPDGNYVAYMVDKDDGQMYIASDIYVYSVAAAKTQKLTNTNDVIEMYPEWNTQDGILYHSDDGSTYLMKIKID